MHATEEGTGLAELLGRAQPARRVLLPENPDRIVEIASGGIRPCANHAAEPIGLEGARRQAVDGHVMADRLAGETSDEAG